SRLSGIYKDGPRRTRAASASARARTRAEATGVASRTRSVKSGGRRMSDQKTAARARAALEAGEGILRLAPTWVPRSFLMPGGRLKLATNDLYALGTHRGGIDERRVSSP